MLKGIRVMDVVYFRTILGVTFSIEVIQRNPFYSEEKVFEGKIFGDYSINFVNP